MGEMSEVLADNDLSTDDVDTTWDPNELVRSVDDLTVDYSGPAVAEPEPVAETLPVEDGPDLLDMIMARIVDITDADKFLRICIYGAPGTRKTTFTASALVPLIYEIDTGGTKSLMRDPNLRNVKKLPFTSMTQFNLIMQYLVNDDSRLSEYETFIIDTYNGLQSRDLSEIPAMSDGKPNYNINTQNLKRITDQLKHINKHVIITAHVKEVKDEQTGRILLRPDLTDKVAGAVYGDFDIIGYMTVEGDDWKLQLQKTDNITAKSRINGLPDVMINPDFSTILAAYDTMRANAKGVSN